MNENAKAWVAALRSGRYRQVTTVLTDVIDDETDDRGFCCLGVACEVMGLEVVPRDDDSRYRFEYENESTVLPVSARRWLGVDDDNPKLAGLADVLTRDGIPTADIGLAALNDRGFTFDQIADLVEYFGLYGWED